MTDREMLDHFSDVLISDPRLLSLQEREDHQVEKCQLTLELRQCWRRKSGGTRLRISLPPSSACEIADIYCCRDRVKIAFLGSPFPYPQISSVRFSCS